MNSNGSRLTCRTKTYNDGTAPREATITEYLSDGIKTHERSFGQVEPLVRKRTMPMVDESVVWYMTGMPPVKNVADFSVIVALNSDGLHIKMMQLSRDEKGVLCKDKTEEHFIPFSPLEDKLKAFLETYSHEVLPNITQSHPVGDRS